MNKGQVRTLTTILNSSYITRHARPIAASDPFALDRYLYIAFMAPFVDFSAADCSNKPLVEGDYPILSHTYLNDLEDIVADIAVSIRNESKSIADTSLLLC